MLVFSLKDASLCAFAVVDSVTRSMQNLLFYGAILFAKLRLKSNLSVSPLKFRDLFRNSHSANVQHCCDILNRGWKSNPFAKKSFRDTNYNVLRTRVENHIKKLYEFFPGLRDREAALHHAASAPSWHRDLTESCSAAPYNYPILIRANRNINFSTLFRRTWTYEFEDSSSSIQTPPTEYSTSNYVR